MLKFESYICIILHRDICQSLLCDESIIMNLFEIIHYKLHNYSGSIQWFSNTFKHLLVGSCNNK